MTAMMMRMSVVDGRWKTLACVPKIGSWPMAISRKPLKCRPKPCDWSPVIPRAMPRYNSNLHNVTTKDCNRSFVMSSPENNAERDGQAQHGQLCQ